MGYFLSEFDFEVLHRAWIKMGHVDALIRAPANTSEDIEVVLDERLEVFSTMSEEE